MTQSLGPKDRDLSTEKNIVYDKNPTYNQQILSFISKERKIIANMCQLRTFYVQTCRVKVNMYLKKVIIMWFTRIERTEEEGGRGVEK